MSGALEQARTLLEAAALFGVALTLLYWVFGLYLAVINRLAQLIGVHGAILSCIQDRANRSKWWMRVPLAWSRWYQGRAR